MAGLNVGLGLLIFFLSLPLVCRKVPMNHYYGVRIRAAFESRQQWYDINAYGGRQLARWSWLIVLCGLSGFFVPEKYVLEYSWVSVAVTLATLLVPLSNVVRWSREDRGTRDTVGEPETPHLNGNHRA